MYVNKNLHEVKDGKCSIFLSNGFNGFSFGQSLNPIIISIKQYNRISKKCEHLFGTDEFKKFENSDEDVLVFSQKVKEYLGVMMLAIEPSDCYQYTSIADKEKIKIVEEKLYEKIGLKFDSKKTDSSLRDEKKLFFNEHLNKAATGSRLIVLNDGIDSTYKENILCFFPINPVILTIDEYKDLSDECDAISGNNIFKTFEDSSSISIDFDNRTKDYLGYSGLFIGFKKWFETISESEREKLEQRKANLFKKLEIKHIVENPRGHKRNPAENQYASKKVRKGD